jgi:dihydroneopterin aldolase
MTEILKEITDNKQNYSQLIIELTQAIKLAIEEDDHEVMIDYKDLITDVIEVIDRGSSSDSEALFEIKLMLENKLQ